MLITGCSSGIGLETAIECAKEGHTVFATMRNLSKSSELEKRIKKENLENINIVQLDVSDSSSIADTIASVVRKTPKIESNKIANKNTNVFFINSIIILDN